MLVQFPETAETLRHLHAGLLAGDEPKREAMSLGPTEPGLWWAEYPDETRRLFEVEFKAGGFVARRIDGPASQSWFRPNLNYLTNWTPATLEEKANLAK